MARRMACRFGSAACKHSTPHSSGPPLRQAHHRRRTLQHTQSEVNMLQLNLSPSIQALQCKLLIMRHLYKGVVYTNTLLHLPAVPQLNSSLCHLRLCTKRIDSQMNLG
jgi:hypothetical protein